MESIDGSEIRHLPVHSEVEINYSQQMLPNAVAGSAAQDVVFSNRWSSVGSSGHHAMNGSAPGVTDLTASLSQSAVQSEEDTEGTEDGTDCTCMCV